VVAEEGAMEELTEAIVERKNRIHNSSPQNEEQRHLPMKQMIS